MALYQVISQTPKLASGKDEPIGVELQQLPDIQQTDTGKNSLLKWTKHHCRRKVFVNFKSDTDKFNIFVYPYQRFVPQKNEIDLKTRENQKSHSKSFELPWHSFKCFNLFDGTTQQDPFCYHHSYDQINFYNNVLCHIIGWSMWYGKMQPNHNCLQVWMFQIYFDKITFLMLIRSDFTMFCLEEWKICLYRSV